MTTVESTAALKKSLHDVLLPIVALPMPKVSEYELGLAHALLIPKPHGLLWLTVTKTDGNAIEPYRSTNVVRCWDTQAKALTSWNRQL